MDLDIDESGLKYSGGGSQRTCSVEDTLARVGPLCGAFGITRVANVTGLDRVGIPVALAVRPNAKSVSVSQGKGATYAHAKASAMMEAIEIWHAENIDKPVYYGRRRALQKSWRVVDTNQLPQNPDAEFDDRTPALWIEGRELFSGEPTLVPYEMIHADYTRPIQPAHGYFHASTNGLASGNSALEAIFHAAAEVIERDALSLWHFTDEARRSQRRIDPRTVADDECRSLLERIGDAGLVCGLWDITSDIGLPTVLCILHDADANSPHIGLGSGCHAISSVALRRAITEAAQTRLNYISGARDDLELEEYGAQSLDQKRGFAEQALAESACPHDFADVPTRVFKSVRDDVELALSSLKAVGIDEAVWVDLSKEEHGVHVARLVIPGLEAPHDDDNYVAGPRAVKVRDHG